MHISLDTRALNHFIETQGEEFKIEMRRAVISAAAASHKIYLTNESKALIEKTIREEFQTEVLSQFGSWKTIKEGYNTKQKFVLNDDIINDIKAMAKKAVDEQDLIGLARQEIQRNVSEVAGKIEERADQVQRHIEAQIKEIIDNKMVTNVNQYINDEVSRRLTDATRLAGKL